MPRVYQSSPSLLVQKMVRHRQVKRGRFSPKLLWKSRHLLTLSGLNAFHPWSYKSFPCSLLLVSWEGMERVLDMRCLTLPRGQVSRLCFLLWVFFFFFLMLKGHRLAVLSEPGKLTTLWFQEVPAPSESLGSWCQIWHFDSVKYLVRRHELELLEWLLRMPINCFIPK